MPYDQLKPLIWSISTVLNVKHREPRYAVLISGTGRTLENLIHSTQDGRLPGSVVAVISSTPNARGLEIAEKYQIPTDVIERKAFPSAEAFGGRIFDVIASHTSDLVLMAGFLRRLVVPDEWNGRILNIHPALLPEAAFAAGKGYYGDRVHQAVLESGTSRSGATVHLVDADYDSGSVIDTITVPVFPGDSIESLSARVFAAECELYPRAIRGYLRQIRLEF